MIRVVILCLNFFKKARSLNSFLIPKFHYFIEIVDSKNGFNKSFFIRIRDQTGLSRILFDVKKVIISELIDI